ncbi:MAG: tRNA uridine-5-carboxymethylaminomethyl(34) synthesis GTPase MnmE [Thermanaerothrix sp.]|nr:tRNA uridine-5-carboxymethylaminomethyl(34) synthesis GTPase MnmE [Thermanaerothrix sp.]
MTHTPHEDVIAAVSTPWGEGGIGVIRLSGRGSAQVVDKVFRGRSPLCSTPPWTMRHGHLVSEGGVLDEVLAVRFEAPRSYTGEDAAEVHCHGGMMVVQRCLSALIAAGARLAEPGEFTRRAVQNGRMDLTAASGVLGMIRGYSDEALRAASRSLTGATRREMDELLSRLISITSLPEAALDYPEEELPDLDVELLRTELLSLAQDLRDLALRGEAGMALSCGIRAALVGRPNVGKSSLLNRLVREAKAIVTPIPGTTRDLVEAAVIHRGVPLKLVDTAGIRDSNDPVEMLGIQRAKEAMLSSEIRILVLDGSTPPSDDDLKLLALLEKPALAALNKSDKGTLREWRELLDRMEDVPYFEISALNGDGVEELKDRVVETFLSGSSLEGAVSLFRHQVEGLKMSAMCLEEAAKASYLDAMTHLASKARLHMGSAMGRDTTEELLDSVFSNFCIGK